QVVVVIRGGPHRRSEGPGGEGKEREHRSEVDQPQPPASARPRDGGHQAVTSSRRVWCSQVAPSTTTVAAKASAPKIQSTVGPTGKPSHHHSAPDSRLSC